MRHRCGAVMLVMFLGACSPPDRETSVVVRDSSGVSIVESKGPQWPAGAEWRIGDPSTRFESVDVATIFGAVRLANGTTVLGDESGARLLFFGADGAVKKAIGRRGDGPGEFRLPQFLGRAGDTVWVYDYSHARVTRFNAEGELVDIVNLTPPLPSALALGRLPEGSLVVMGQWRGVARGRQGLVRDTIAVVRYRDGVRTDTVATTPGREFVQRAEAGGRMVMSVAVLGRTASATIWNGAVVLGTQTDHSLRVVDLDGREHRLIRWKGPDLTVTAADVAAWVDGQVASASKGDRERLRAVYALSPVPERAPSYSRILADAAGHLWVAEYPRDDAEPSRWDVFASDGVWLGPIRVPRGFRLFDVGRDWVLGAMPDSLELGRLELRVLHSTK